MIKDEKKKIRQLVKYLKGKMTEAEKTIQSENIFKIIEHTTEFNMAQIVVLYWSMDDEVHTHAFIEKWAGIKTILLPVVNGAELDFKIYSNKNALTQGQQFGIVEPTGEIFSDYSKIDLIIVPGIAFDKNNNRMGRGKGFYDKFLTQCPAPKIGICFANQVFDEVPTEIHDIKMDFIISN